MFLTVLRPPKCGAGCPHNIVWTMTRYSRCHDGAPSAAHNHLENSKVARGENCMKPIRLFGLLCLVPCSSREINMQRRLCHSCLRVRDKWCDQSCTIRHSRLIRILPSGKKYVVCHCKYVHGMKLRSDALYGYRSCALAFWDS